MALRVMLLALLGAWLALPRAPAAAQGYYPYTPRTYQGLRPAPYYPAYPSVTPYRPSYSNPYPYPFTFPWSRGQPRDDLDDPAYDSGGRYRTLCVRMCDGYYFPISFSTTRSGFSADADKCTASCGEEAQLFYYPNPGGDVETMVDLTGRAYSELPNAFKYRRKLVESCRCRAQPWSETELARHRAYAAGESPNETVAKPSAEKADRVSAGDAPAALPHGPASAAQHIPARPQPIARQVQPPPLVWPFGSGPSGPPAPRFTWPGDRNTP